MYLHRACSAELGQAGSLTRNWLCCRARIQRRGKTRRTPLLTLLIGPACRRVQLCAPHCFLARCTRIHGPPGEEPNRRSVDFAAVACVSRASEASVGDVILPATPPGRLSTVPCGSGRVRSRGRGGACGNRLCFRLSFLCAGPGPRPRSRARTSCCLRSPFC